MKIKIFILNGVARSGKDTFVNKVSDILYNEHPHIGIDSYSLVQSIKQVIEQISFTNPMVVKDDSSRKLISDLLRIFEDFDGAITTKLVNDVVNDVIAHKYPISVYFLHIREPRDIKTVEHKLSVMLPNAEIRRLLINNHNITKIPNNKGDLSVKNIKYDITINNGEDINKLEELARNFIKHNIF